MATMIRHGGEAHVVRPDRVYRTGVLTSMVGYQPQADVMAVAQAFTQGPPLGTQLSGLGAMPSWLQRIGLRIKAVFAAKKAAQFQQVSQQVAGPPVIPAIPNSPKDMQTAPQIGSQMSFLMSLMRHDQSAFGIISRASHEAAKRRLNTYYYAG